MKPLRYQDERKLKQQEEAKRRAWRKRFQDKDPTAEEAALIAAEITRLKAEVRAAKIAAMREPNQGADHEDEHFTNDDG